MLRLNIRDQFKLFVGKMPKVKGRNHLKLDDIVQEFGSDIFVINSGKISCKLCKIDIQVKKKQDTAIPTDTKNILNFTVRNQ